MCRSRDGFSSVQRLKVVETCVKMVEPFRLFLRPFLMLIFRDMKITFATLFCFSISDTVIASSMMLFLTLYQLGYRVSSTFFGFVLSRDQAPSSVFYLYMEILKLPLKFHDMKITFETLFCFSIPDTVITFGNFFKQLIVIA